MNRDRVKEKTYYGKVCGKHPALKGMRERKGRHCLQCNREGALKWNRAHRDGQPKAQSESARRGLTNVTTALLLRAWIGTIIFNERNAS